MIAAHLPLLQLLRLASPQLPIGGYSYSQGMESAIEHGLVTDAATASRWVGDQISQVLARYEWPLLARMLTAVEAGDPALLGDWNADYWASRETLELQRETEQMGSSLTKLLRDWPEVEMDLGDWIVALDQPTLPGSFALAAHALGVPKEAAVSAYAWAWLENQAAVLMKALPMGQVAAQKMLSGLLPTLAEVVAGIMAVPDEALSGFAPGLAMLSAQHETQYSRLFRS